MSRPVFASNLRVQLQIALWRYGWIWVFVVAVAMAAVGLYFAVLIPSRAAVQSARLALSDAHNRVASSPLRTMRSGVGEQERLALLQGLLRQSPDASELVRKMSTLAYSQQIALVQSDYQYQINSTTQVIQVQITQTVKASYPQLRRYMESVLRAVPNASLDQVVAKRENVGQTLVEARLTWSLWMQPASPVAALAAMKMGVP